MVSMIILAVIMAVVLALGGYAMYVEEKFNEAAAAVQDFGLLPPESIE